MGDRNPVHDPRGLIEIHRPTLSPGPGTLPAREDPLINVICPAAAPRTATAPAETSQPGSRHSHARAYSEMLLLPSRTQAVAAIDDRPGQAGGMSATAEFSRR